MCHVTIGSYINVRVSVDSKEVALLHSTVKAGKCTLRCGGRTGNDETQMLEIKPETTPGVHWSWFTLALC